MSWGDGTRDSAKLSKRLGARIRRRREELGLDLTTLAHSVGVTQSELAAMEAGARRLTPAELALLAAQLQVVVAWFFELAAAPVLGADSTESDTPEVSQSPTACQSRGE